MRHSFAAALFLATVTSLAQTHVVLTPQASTLLSGRSRAFQVRLATGGGQRPAMEGCQVDLPRPGDDWVWRILDGGVGTLDASTGTYTAPVVARPELVRIQIQCGPVPDLEADALILVLPHEPFDVVAKVLGPDWLEPYRGDRPFRDQATGLRLGEGRKVRAITSTGAPLRAGCGLPATLNPRSFVGAQAVLLQAGTGPGTLTKDITGLEAVALPTTAHLEQATVEALQRAQGRPGLWWSQVQTFPVHLRGLVPMAGNAVAGPGHADGTGASARFREPFGVARVRYEDPEGLPQAGFLVSDAGSHTLRLVEAMGQVRTLWGAPDQPGHLDAVPTGLLGRLADALHCRRREAAVSRFHRPTFLDAFQTGPEWVTPDWWCAVADTGNHVVRRVAMDGTTRTLGGVPGQAGHRDGRDALFNDPQGVAVDILGNVYVADRGNCVIRLIRTNGEVDTVAGRPGEPGVQDGRWDQARFRALRGLALVQRPQVTYLYIADGHALRRLELPGHTVTTVLGQVDQPGFREIRGGSRGHRSHLLREPCLNRPCGLVGRQGGVDLADEGNHAVRRFDPENLTLTTLAGDPQTPGLRWGLVRDGLEPPLDASYATLDAPRCLAQGPQEGLAVTTGTCLTALGDALAGRDELRLMNPSCLSVRAGEPCLARFFLDLRTPFGTPTHRTIHFSVDFLEADGTVGERLRGTGAGPGLVEAKGALLQRGTGTVVVRCVSDQGVSAGVRIPVQVQ